MSKFSLSILKSFSGRQGWKVGISTAMSVIDAVKLIEGLVHFFYLYKDGKKEIFIAGSARDLTKISDCCAQFAITYTYATKDLFDGLFAYGISSGLGAVFNLAEGVAMKVMDTKHIMPLEK